MTSPKKIVLVTGANNGIGLNCVKLLSKASNEYHVLLGSRSLEKGDKALLEVRSCDPQSPVSLLQLDVTSATSIQSAVDHIEKRFGQLDVLVHNAGITSSATSLLDQLRSTFETNTFGPAVLTEAMIPLLKQSQDPRIVFVTSELGSINRRADRGYIYDAIDAMAYRMSKSALNMLAVCHTKYAESWRTPAKVWCYDPGFCVTDLTSPEDRQNRVENGARSSEAGALGLLPIIKGERDVDSGKMINDSGVLPW